jgi:hypothetical protein
LLAGADGAAGFAAGVADDGAAEDDAEDDPAAGFAVFLWRCTLAFAGVWLCAGAAVLGLAGVAGAVGVDCANRATEASIEVKINFFISFLPFLCGMLSVSSSRIHHAAEPDL